MSHQFGKHYTRAEAQALLPQVRTWLSQLVDLRDRLGRFDKRVGSLLANGDDVGGESVNGWVRTLVQLQSILGEFRSREIQVKDVDRGLLDFPAIVQGREVFLCWEQGEEDIGFWHDLNSGYAGRERLI